MGCAICATPSMAKKNKKTLTTWLGLAPSWLWTLLLALSFPRINSDERPSFFATNAEGAKSPLPVILTKVGGSSITEKGSFETLDEAALQWLAKTMKQNLHPAFLADKPDGKNIQPDPERPTKESIPEEKVAYVLIHGAGSFGHFHAKQYGIQSLENIDVNKPASPHGLAQTRRSVQSLNQHVLSSLLDEGINAIGISPGFYGLCNDKEALSLSLRHAVRDALEAGLIPVLHGDGCLLREETPLESTTTTAAKDQTADVKRVVMLPAIISGDLLVQMLAGGYDQHHFLTQGGIIFLTDVDGVFTADPKRYTNATLLPWIAVKNGKDDQPHLSFPVAARGTHSENNNEDQELSTSSFQDSSHQHDVTGGLAGKLKAAISIVRSTQQNVTIARFGTMRALQLLSNNGRDVDEKSDTDQGRETKIEGGTVLFWHDDDQDAVTKNTVCVNSSASN